MSEKSKQNLLLTMSIAALFSTGCSNMLYSNNSAPIYDRTGAKPQTAQQPVEWKATGQPSTQTATKVTEPPVVSSTANTPYQPPSAIEQPAKPVVNNNTGYVANQTVGNTSEFGTTQDPFQNSPKVNSTDPRIKNAGTISDTAQQPAAVIRPQTPVTTADSAASDTETNTVAESKPAPTTLRPEAPVAKPKPKAPAKPTPDKPENTPAKPKTTDVATKTPVKKPAGTGSAVKDLLQSAKKAVVAGNYEKAASELERAHRIKPGDAKILFDIAQVRFAQGKYSQAESFASRAAGVAKSARMKKKIWTLLSKARKALGNNSGAASALKKAQSF